MVLNPRGLNNFHEVDEAVEAIRSLPPVRYKDNPQGRFMAEVARQSGKVPLSRASCGSVRGNCGVWDRFGAPDLGIGGVGGVDVRGSVPGLVDTDVGESVVYSAAGGDSAGGIGGSDGGGSGSDDMVDDKDKAGGSDGGKSDDLKGHAKALGGGLWDSANKWPVAPIVIGGVIILIMFALHKVMK